jgi:hypothetical protein
VGYYAAYALDPDGNNIEVVNHHDQSAVQPQQPGTLRLTKGPGQVRST